MWKKSICTASLVLISALLSNSYAAVIGDWEDVNDGWEITDSAPEGTTMAYSDTNGVTLGSYSLKLSVPVGEYQTAICLKLQEHPELIPVFRNNNKIRVDITRFAADWTGSPTNGQSGIHIIINAGGEGMDNLWEDLGYQGWWKYDQSEATQTIEWDYSSALSKINFGGVWWLEIWFISNYDPAYTSGGVYYLDNFQIPTTTKASEPRPADAQTDLDRDVDLVFKPGEAALTHHVYFGTNRDDVNDVTITTLASYPNVTFWNLDVNSVDPGTLLLEETYYWRVDEANEPDIWKGDVWSFTVGNFLVVDDIEDYNDYTPDRVFETWLDGFGYGVIGEPPYSPGNGTGSIVGYDTFPFAERTIVHSGLQSLPYYYDTNFKYAEATADTSGPNSLDISPDLTAEGFNALSLWFYGDPNNASTQMYVMLEDGSFPPNLAVLYYDGSPDDITVASWHEWRMPLSAFTGVDLTNVARIGLGFGQRGNTTQPGGSGNVLFDDIRLYRAECMLDERSSEFARLDFMPQGVPGGDCRVDMAELEVLMADWLLTDGILPTEDPAPEGGLVAYYKMDEGAGVDVADLTGNGHNGLISNGASWVAPGYDGIGSAVNIDGGPGSKVDINDWNPSAGTGQLSLALWTRWAGPFTGNDHHGLVGKRDTWGADAMMWFFEINTGGGNNQLQFRQYSTAATDVYTANNAIDPFIGRWAHLAVTFDSTTARVYLNATEVGSGPFVFGPATDATMAIGNTHGTAWDGSEETYNGDIDEVRIYNRALSPAEVAYLADITPADGQMHVPVPSAADLYDAEEHGQQAVNFKDFAVLADRWLDSELWPR